MIKKIKQFLSTHRKKLIIFQTIILIALNITTFWYLFEFSPQSNDECLWDPRKLPDGKPGIFFDLVKFEGVAWNAGIRDGDQLLKINDIEIDNTVSATRILNNIEKGDTAVYQVKRNNEVFEARLSIKKLQYFHGIGFALLGFIWLLVGFIVVMAKYDGLTQILFYRLGVLSTLFSLFAYTWGGELRNPEIFSRVWLILPIDILWLAGSTFLPFVLIHFFWVFPNRLAIVEKKYTTKILYITPVIILIISLIFRFIYLYKPLPLQNIPKIVGGLVFNLQTNLILAGLLVGLVSLFINYVRLETKQARDSIFVILISYTVGVLTIFYTFQIADQLSGFIFNNPEYYMPIIIIAIIPISFAYSIFRYSLMDVSDVFKNALLYGTATLSIAGLYFLIIYVLGQSISKVISTDYQGLIALAVFIIFAFVFQSTKDKFQELLTQKFYPEQFVFQKVLLKFSNEISTIVGLENILSYVNNTFIDSLKLSKFGILLAHKNHKYILKKGPGFKDNQFFLENKEALILRLIPGKVKLKRQPIFEREEFEEVFTEDYQKLVEESIYTIIPLVIKSKVIGLLLFSLKYSGARFAGKDLELLVAAGNQISVSIENARLYESEAQKQKMERDLENARTIQESLLPKYIPTIRSLDISGKMIPAMQVGGDYYDLIKISDEKIFVIIGDVSGKGLSASFYMSQLQTMVRLFCTSDKSPKQVLTELNERIFGNIEKNWFITVSIVFFDSSKNKLIFARAGHTPLIHVSDNKLNSLQPAGIGLGLEKGEIFNSTLVEQTVDFKEGDQFVLFSDGITESMNSKKELFGMKRLSEILLDNHQKSSGKILASVIKSVEDFNNDPVGIDDITLVVIKIR